MNRQIRQLAVGLMACYVALFAALNYWQVGREEQLNAEPENTRALLRQFDQPRGPIVSADGVVLARSIPMPPDVDSDVDFQRQYPTGELFAHVTGYHTFGLGSTQIERTQGDVLTGDTATQQLRAIGSLLGGEPDTSGTVVLTMRNDLQEFAREQLGDREGSIVMIDPRTGAVQAMWSYPSYDPNIVADADYDVAFDYLTQLQDDDRDPLLANAYQQRYMPGSTFKVLTTGVALDDGVIGLDSYWEPETQYTPPQTTDPIENYAGSLCGGFLPEVFARSCNTPFARTAVELGPDRFVAGMERWGIGEEVPIDLPRPAASTIGPTDDLDQQLPLLAIRGFGQNEDQMVPLHMALVAGAVANGGSMMRPYVVAETVDQQGDLLERTSPRVWRTPITAATAETLKDLMVGVAEVGTASCCIALENGISVAAKTGTAQLNATGEPERSHLWIVAFAPVEDPQYAVAVMLKGTDAQISAGTGGRFAGPIAKAMLDEAFRSDARAAAGTGAAGTTEPGAGATDGGGG